MPLRIVENKRTMAADGGVLVMQTIQTRTPVAEADEGAPAVDFLLGHACGLCKDALAPLAFELQDRIPAARQGCAVGFDFRGHGDSRPLIPASREMVKKEPSVAWTLGEEDVRTVCGSGVLSRPTAASGNAFEQQPLVVGVGHSTGGAALLQAQLAEEEAPLFDALILFEPSVDIHEADDARRKAMVVGTISKQTVFPSLAEAEVQLKATAPFRSWDSRALDGFLATGLRPSWAMPPPATGASDRPYSSMYLACAPGLEAAFHATAETQGFRSRPLGSSTAGALRRRLPPTLIVVGADSGQGAIANAEELRRRLRSGAMFEEDEEEGSAVVDLVTVDGVGHHGPMERPGAVAEVAATWLSDRVLPAQRVFREENERWLAQDGAGLFGALSRL